MKTALFDFPLPEELIAQVPAAERRDSRLLVYDRARGEVRHWRFHQLVDLIPPGDLLVLNRSRVVPARLLLPGAGGEAGAKPAEILFVKDLGGGRCLAMVRPGRKFKPGRVLPLPTGGTVRVEEVTPDGLRLLSFPGESEALAPFRSAGEMPLPPYITSRESSPERYQTVYAREEGSIAAPTAGLHFDPELLGALESRGVLVGTVTLHVGMGTFKPIETEEVESHRMHAEEFTVETDFAERFAAVRRAGGKVWACGTTSVRTLESAFQAEGSPGEGEPRPEGTLRTGRQSTDCYLRPGHRFAAVDHLLTNFHLPRSTLLVLVAAFCGRETILDLYRQAIAARYRFFSFGDAMCLI